MTGDRYYLLTGAAGFLGSNICAQLLREGKKVRALVLPNDKSVKFIPKEVEVVIGDLCDEASLEPFFTVPEGCTSAIIHCASMVTVDPGYSEKLMAVNVGGTRNIITKVLAHPECEKMVYVSSTGTIPEQPHGTQARAQQRGDIAGTTGQVQHPVARAHLRGRGEVALPHPVDAQAHQVVHEVVAARHGRKHLADQLLLFPHRDVAEAEMGGTGIVGCAHGAIIAPPG